MLTIETTDIKVLNRTRTEFGDIDELANSITKHGLIQPIIIERGTNNLIVGERRLRALTRLGIIELEHGIHFLWRGEEAPLRRKAVELEENIRRKAFTWQEEVRGKKELLDIMTAIHGDNSSGGGTNIIDKTKPYGAGFSTVKLAALLGESQSQISKDLTVARALKSFPQLASQPTKTSALSRMRYVGAVSSAVLANIKAKESVKSTTPSTTGEQSDPPKDNFTIYRGDFRDHSSKIPDNSVDFIHTDLPYGVNMDSIARDEVLGESFDDSHHGALELLPVLVAESFRVLRPNRFGVFWFGFVIYDQLVKQLEKVGFKVNPVPLIWTKPFKVFNHNPYTKHSHQYEAALIVSKGNPVMLRPGPSDVKSFAGTNPNEKVHIAEKPVALIHDIMKDLVTEGSHVVDFTAGSGSTGEAALLHKCTPTLFELDSSLCQIIEARLRKAQSK